MIRLAFILLFLPCAIFAQTTYYVATDGNNGNPGTLAEPWRTWDYAFARLNKGDTLYIRGGIYYSAATASIDPYAWPSPIGESGTADSIITIRGYPPDIASSSDTTWSIINGDTVLYTIGNYPVLDCRYHEDSIPDPGWNIYNAGISLNRVQYIQFRDFKICNVWQIDSVVSGAFTSISVANITYDNIELYNIGQRGFYHTSGAWSYIDSLYAVDILGRDPNDAIPYFDQPDTTRWINCDVYNLFDTLANQPGNAADGWKTISYPGNYYYWEGCRAWHYADDGFDPNGGKRVFKNCWAMATNKFANSGSGWSPERNGYKTSSSLRNAYISLMTYEDSAKYVNDSLVQFYNSLALFCNGSGFTYGQESDTTDNPRYNNTTSYANGIGYSHVITGSLDDASTFFRNCIVYASTSNNAIGQPYDISYGYCPYDVTNSTWQYKSGYPGHEDNPAFSLDSNDFVEIDSATLVSRFTAARQADGSLPVQRPLMLASTSDLIDGGVDLGESYNGTAPDLGYSEYSDVTIPVAAFSADNTTVCKEDSVQFTDATTNTPLTWAWSFPGGSPDTSNLQNPKIEYPTAGTYSVSLYVTNADSSDTETKTNYITVRDSVVADFSASATSVNTGANISFTDLTTNNPSSWSWTFAGGTPSVSTSQNPTIQYNTAGTYTVTLEATNTCNSDTEQKVGYITVSNPYAPASNYRLIIKFR